MLRHLNLNTYAKNTNSPARQRETERVRERKSSDSKTWKAPKSDNRDNIVKCRHGPFNGRSNVLGIEVGKNLFFQRIERGVGNGRGV